MIYLLLSEAAAAAASVAAAAAADGRSCWKTKNCGCVNWHRPPTERNI